MNPIDFPFFGEFTNHIETRLEANALGILSSLGTVGHIRVNNT